MLTCSDSAPAPFACPSLDDSIQATAALLPRGAAWPANDGGGTMAAYLEWISGGDPDNDVFNPADVFTPPDVFNLDFPASPDDWPAGFVQCGFIAAIGAVRNWIESRVCDLKGEFFCASANETLDLWNAEYGLPDQCDPFPNLCVKVGTFGGADVAYWTELAASLGWSIKITQPPPNAPSMFGASELGAAQFGSGVQPTQIDITVFLAESPAYVAQLGDPSIFGVMQFGARFGNLPDIASLTCAFDRIMPAHLTVVFTTVDQ